MKAWKICASPRACPAVATWTRRSRSAEFGELGLCGLVGLERHGDQRPRGPGRIDGIAPYSATVAISEVREFDQTDVPDFTGALNSRLEAYGAPGTVHPANLYEAQRRLGR
jgi:hypothetical protein